MCSDESKGQPWKLWVTLAGVAERYSNGILGMRCLVSSLHKMSASASAKPNSYISATSSARFNIEMWRSVGLLMWANPDAFSMTMEMFTHRFDIAKVIANRAVHTITDASGWRICVAIYDSNNNALIRWSSYLFPFKLVPELYQNNREYLGVLMSLMLFRLEFPYRTSSSNGSPDIFQFKWMGDNMSALSWVEKEKCNSVWGQTAAMVFTWFQIYSNTFVNEVEHLPGVLMGDIDHNSRDRFAESLVPEKFVSLESIPKFASLIELLDPSIVRNLSQHHNSFITIHALLSSILCVSNDTDTNNDND